MVKIYMMHLSGFTSALAARPILCLSDELQHRPGQLLASKHGFVGIGNGCEGAYMYEVIRPSLSLPVVDCASRLRAKTRNKHNFSVRGSLFLSVPKSNSPWRNAFHSGHHEVTIRVASTSFLLPPSCQYLSDTQLAYYISNNTLRNALWTTLPRLPKHSINNTRLGGLAPRLGSATILIK